MLPKGQRKDEAAKLENPALEVKLDHGIDKGETEDERAFAKDIAAVESV